MCMSRATKAGRLDAATAGAEQVRDAVRATLPCDKAMVAGKTCIDAELERPLADGGPRYYTRVNPVNLCPCCQANWFASRTAQLVAGQAKLAATALADDLLAAATAKAQAAQQQQAAADANPDDGVAGQTVAPAATA